MTRTFAPYLNHFKHLDIIIPTLHELPSQFQTWELLAAMVVVMLGATFQYSMGIGFGVFVAPLLALINIKFVPVPVLILTFLTSFSSVLSEWRLVNGEQVRLSVTGRLFGSILAASLVGFLPDEKPFMLIFGLVVGLMVLVSLGGITIPFNRKSISTAGFVSGITATLTSVGGPPMAIVYQNQKSSDARPTLQLFFLFGSLLSTLALMAVGFVSTLDFLLAAGLLPGLLAGLLLGPRMRPHFDRNFRYWILGVAAISSIMLIHRGLS